METHHIKNSLLMLAIGEIISLVITIIILSVRMSNNSASGWISFLAIVALLLEFFAFIRLRPVNVEFKNAFVSVLVVLLFILLEGIFGIVALNNGGSWAVSLSSTCSVVNSIVSILTFVLAVRGCKLLLQDVCDNSFLNKVLYGYLIVTFIYVLLIIALSVPQVFDNDVSRITLSAIAILASSFTTLFALYALFRTRQSLD